MKAPLRNPVLSSQPTCESMPGNKDKEASDMLMSILSGRSFQDGGPLQQLWEAATIISEVVGDSATSLKKGLFVRISCICYADSISLETLALHGFLTISTPSRCTLLIRVKFLKPNLFYLFRSSWDYIRVKLTPELVSIRKVNKRKNYILLCQI